MKKYYLLSLFLGILSSFAFQPYGRVWLLFLIYSFFFMLLSKAETKRNFWMIGFSFGFGQGAISMSWLVHALLISPAQFGNLIPLIPLGFGLFFGLFASFPTLCCYKAKSLSSQVLIFAGSFTIFEWIRSWLFSGFPWNLVGSVWTAHLSILQTASFCGVYGLTLLSIIWFCIPVLIIKKKYKFALFSSVLFLLSLGFGNLRLYEANHEYEWGVELRLIQPNIPQTLKWNADEAEENFMKHVKLSKNSGFEKISHVLWSETAVPYPLDINDEIRAMTMMAVKQDTSLITGGLRVADEERRQLANSIFVLNDLGQIINTYDKSHLVPFGEYIPLRGILPFDKIVPISSDFKAGPGPQTIRIPNAPPAGMLVCYEIIFPGQVVNKNQHRPSWLINVTNDAWYGISAGPYQHLAAAQMRAVEEGLPVVRVAGTGISAVINPWGEIINSLPLGSEGVLDSKLPKKLEKITFYGRLGNVIPLFFSLMFIFIGIILNKKEQKSD